MSCLCSKIFALVLVWVCFIALRTPSSNTDINVKYKRSLSINTTVVFI